MLIIVDIPDESLNNRDQELEAIVNALMGGLEHGKFGDTVGTGFGESTSEVYLLIRARKYPEAIRGIRSALKDAGVSNFDLSLND